MSSILKVNTIQDIDGNNIINESGNVITIGASGDTITVPAGATVSGFTSAGIDDNATSTAITISSGEDVTFTENILLGDNKKAKFGTGNDLEIFHDGSSSIISDVGTGRLILRSDGDGVDINKGTSENIAKFRSDAGVELYYDNSKKFETTSSGVTVTGNINLGDSNVINLGASNDLQIFHSNSGSFIKDAGTSNLFIDTDGNAIELTSGNTAESMGRFVKDGAVELYHNNSKKFETAADGILVNGAANIDAGGEPSATGMIKLQANSTTRQLRISPPSDSANGKIDYRGGNLTFQDDGTEVARFQDTTALMIGKSSLDYEGTAGIILRNDGLLHVTRSGGNVTDFNRLSSDGEVVRFSKDGTTSGQINISGSRMNIGTGNTAIRFDSNSRLILPWNVTSNSATGVDNAIDLGASGGFGFKDLYLGGGVFLGGTGTANKLDDYEEGTWTPDIATAGGTLSVTYAERTGKYTKIGNVVYYEFYIETSGFSGGSGDITFSAFPFTAQAGRGAIGLAAGSRIDLGIESAVIIPDQNATTFKVRIKNSTGTGSSNNLTTLDASDWSNLNPTILYGAGYYRTDS